MKEHRASTFSLTTLEADMIEVNHVNITEKKILCTKNPVVGTHSPIRVKEIYLRICKHSKNMSLTFSNREKDI